MLRRPSSSARMTSGNAIAPSSPGREASGAAGGRCGVEMVVPPLVLYELRDGVSLAQQLVDHGHGLIAVRTPQPAQPGPQVPHGRELRLVPPPLAGPAPG